MPRRSLTEDELNLFRQRASAAALELFSDHAPEEITLRRIAKALGCSHATPYRYFESKEALFMAVRAEAFSRFGTYLRRRLDGVEGAAERIHAVSAAYFDFARDETGAFRIMFQLGHPSREYPEYREAPQATWSIVEQVVAEAHALGAIEGDVPQMTHLFWSAVHGITSLHLAARFSMGIDGSALLRPMVDALLRSLAPVAEDG